MNLPPRTLLMAVVLHVAVLGLIFGGIQCSRKVVAPVPMEAVLIDADSLAAMKPVRSLPAKTEPEPVAPPPEPKAEPPPPEPEPKPEPKPEPPPPPKPDPQILAQQAEQAELKAQVAAQKKAEAAAKKLEAAEAKRATLDLATAAAQEDLRRQASREEKSRDAEKIREHEEMLKEQLADEAKARDAARSGQRASALNAWTSAIARAIRSNYVRPPSSLEDFQCPVGVVISPSGTVISARIVKSCGSGPVDESVLRAVYKSDPLPIPSDPSVFDRNLTFIFHP